MTRRLLVGGTAALALTVLNACGSDENPSASTPTQTGLTPDIPVGPASTEASLQIPDIDKYYPELKDEKLFQNGEFVTTQNTQIAWYNFTEHEFHEDAALAMYDFVQGQVAGEPRHIGDVPERGTEVGVFLYPQLSVQKQVVFILPEGAPKTSWIRPGEGMPQTGINLFEDALVSYVLVTSNEQNHEFFRDQENYTNTLLGVQTCYTNILVAGPQNQDTRVDLQDMYCNVTGVSIAAKQKGLTYSDYEDIMTNPEMIQRNGGDLHYSEALYADIPQVGNVITVLSGQVA